MRPSQPSLSSVPKTQGRPCERTERPPASAQTPADPDATELHFRKAIDTLPGFVWSALPDGSLECCNQSWLEYTGMSRDQVAGCELADSIHPQDKSDFQKQWRTASTHDAPFETAARMRRADGSYRWFSIRAVPLRTAMGGVSRWHGINTDIHDLKQAQQELPGLSSRSDALFEEAPEAVAMLSADDRVVRINKEFTRIFGYEPDEVLGRPIDDFIFSETHAESTRECIRQLKNGHRVEFEMKGTRKDGTPIYLSILAVPITTASGGQVLGAYAIYRDIGDRKRAEGRLLESEARFQSIADTAPVMIWTTDTDGLCNYFSKPWREFTGRTMEQELGTGWVEGVHPDDMQTCGDCFWKAFHARKSFRVEYRLRRADGEYRWVDESGIPRYTIMGEFAGYIGCNIDIADRKRAEEERERLHRLEADIAHINRVSMMGELAASLAHEIKQPIAAASMNASACARWLQSNPPDLAEASRGASRMVNDVRCAAEIIDRVRSLYTRDTSKRQLLDLNELIQEMIVLLHDKANRTSIAIHTELTPKLPRITADRVQMQQVLMNLMLNGIEAMKEGSGELTVTSKRCEDGQVLVSVSDSGVGLPAGATENIFEAFFTTKPQGTGMGLSISRRIIESHEGRLWAASNARRGATFQFALPSELTAS